MQFAMQAVREHCKSLSDSNESTLLQWWAAASINAHKLPVCSSTIWNI